MRTGKHVGRQKVWAYVVEDLAELFGMSVEATRKAIQRDRFDPANLSSIFEFAMAQRSKEKPDENGETPPPKLPE